MQADDSDEIRPSSETVMLDGGFTMIFDKDVAVRMSDGLRLRVNVFRPAGNGRYPVVMSHGIYGKDVHFSHAFKPQWDKLTKTYPDLARGGSSGRFLRWEVPDPERWVPNGFIIVVADTRGSGKSPGYLDPRQPREDRDYYELIEWAGVQDWSNGKVGLLGISYLAINQWKAAALRPPHLAAICPWEGHWDHYRDASHHGGILSNTFSAAWWPRQVLSNQHGNGTTHYVDADTGKRSTGPALGEDMLKCNREDHPVNHLRHRLDDQWHRARTPDMSAIEVPVLSAGNWGGPGVHLRGNVAGFVEAASKDKWLSMHIGTHFDSFYMPDYVAMQQRFFGHFLRGDDNGWDHEPRVRLEIRDVHDRAKVRKGNDWPLKETVWTRFYLDADGFTLGPQSGVNEAAAQYQAMGEGVTFRTPPLEADLEITGYVAVRLVIASSTTDMDIFAVLRAFDPSGREVILTGAHEPTPVSRGWLRASHRRKDVARSLPHRPYLVHDGVQKLKPGERYVVDVEIWPTSLVFPKGYRLALTIMGKDFEIEGVPGRILHNDPSDRPSAEFGGMCSIFTGGANESFLLLPVIPS